MTKDELIAFIDSNLIEIKLIGNDGFDGQEIKDGKEYLKEQIAALNLFDVSGSLPLTFEQCLREEFLINTQNYPREYHNLFNQKFNRARKRFEEQ